MATDRVDWLPDIESRICDMHFSISDYKDGNKNNNLLSNACPLFYTPSNVSIFIIIGYAIITIYVHFVFYVITLRVVKTI